MRARIKPYVTDLHVILVALIVTGEAVWKATYVYLNPANPQLYNALQAAVYVIVAIIVGHGYVSLKVSNAALQQQLIAQQKAATETPAQPTGPVPAFDPLANRQPPYTHN